MPKNKSRKTKVPVLDDKGYAEYLDYLKREDYGETNVEVKCEGQVSVKASNVEREGK